MASSPTHIREVLETYWYTIFPRDPCDAIAAQGLSENHPLRGVVGEEDAIRFDEAIERGEVAIAIKGLRNGTSDGPTDIPIFALKNSTGTALMAMTKLFNDWFQTADYPLQGQQAEVTLLHKKGNRNDINNYRTLSVNCNLCKVYLRVLTNRLSRLIDNTRVLGDAQSGFRRGRRTTDNLFVLKACLEYAWQRKRKGFAVYLDAAKAYDTVDRKILFQKLRDLGIGERWVEAVKATYRAPGAVLKHGGVKTNALPMHKGLRQGCPLSCVLFLLYIVDLTYDLDRSGYGLEIPGEGGISRSVAALYFADDVVLLAKNKIQCQILLDMAGDFASTNKMKFSGAKSVVIPIANPPNLNHRWQMHDGEGRVVAEMSESASAKYLGLSVGRGIDCYKANNKIIIRRLRILSWATWSFIKNLTRRPWTAAVVWNTYVLPAALYGAELLTISKSDVEQAQRIQNNFFKSVFSVPRGTANVTMFLETGVLSITAEYAKKVIQFYHHTLRAPPESLVAHTARYFLWRHITTGSNYYMVVQNMLNKYRVFELPEHTRFRPSTLNNWVRTVENRVAYDSVTNYITLRYYMPHKAYCRREWTVASDILWWERARIGGLYLGERQHRTATRGRCQVCRSGAVETLEHFLLYCPGLVPTMPNYPGQGVLDDQAWLLARLNFDYTTAAERLALATAIKQRWLCRGRIIG